MEQKYFINNLSLSPHTCRSPAEVVVLSPKKDRPVEESWERPADEVLEEHSVSQEEGLDRREVKERRKKFGRNKLKETKKKSRWKIFIQQFKSLLVVLLGIAAIISLVIGEMIEGVSILAVLVINAIIGFVTEARA
ncbi:MAG: cation-transporting P-type ATPase, partial [Candidatus Natronoplasma sp.]